MVGRAVDGQRAFSLHLFIDMFDRWCGLWPVLSCCCLLLFESWVDFWSFWECLCSICGRFGNVFVRFVVVLRGLRGVLGPLLGVLRALGPLLSPILPQRPCRNSDLS